MYENIFQNIKKCLPKKIKRFHVHEPILSEKVFDNINRCLKSNIVSSSGYYIDKFTRQLMDITGSKYILLTSSGTTALFSALNEIGVDDKEVIVPSMTFVATANSVIHAGGLPVFLDNSKYSLNLSSIDLEDFLHKNYKVEGNKCINRNTQKVLKCIILVHAYGDAADTKSICEVAKKYMVEVIEDAAGALGSYKLNRHVGTYSRMGILSFNGNKIITTGMGGALICKRKKDFMSISHKISTARVKHDWKIEHDKIGYNLRMANINAALGYGQIINIKKILKYKKKLNNNYCEIFRNNKYCYISEIKDSQNNNWVTNLYIRDKYIDKHQAIIKYLHKNHIYVRELWKPMHLLPMFKKNLRSKMTNSINRWKAGISLPSSYYK